MKQSGPLAGTVQQELSEDIMKYISFSLIIAFAVLAGCAHQKEEFSKRSPDSIYSQGMKLMKEKSFTDAASEFKDIEMLFPYSKRAVDGQIMAAYAYYRAKSYGDALRELDIFEKYHPSHGYIPYAMYLRAMCLYMQISSIGRDSKMAFEAKIAFIKLVNRFPQSKYHKDCIQKVERLNDLLAAHEMSIARFYQKNQSALAAIGRYNYVIATYPTSKYTAEAYFRIIECCQSIGLTDEANTAYKSMQQQFKVNLWSQRASRLISKGN